VFLYLNVKHGVNLFQKFSKMDVILFNDSETQLTPEQDLILIDVFGYSSGVFVGITLLPQVIKVLKTKSTKDLSHIFLALSLIAAVLKLIYGVLINQLPIVVTAPIIGIETLIIMIAKCVYDRRIKERINKYDGQEGEIKYKNEDINIEISKNKIIINTIEFEYNIQMVEDIINYISKKEIEL
jgi:MtN3 and saliva related transmembrane protein